jgi:hypothetical protein
LKKLKKDIENIDIKKHQYLRLALNSTALKNTESAEKQNNRNSLERVEDYTKATVELAKLPLLTFQQMVFLH